MGPAAGAEHVAVAVAQHARGVPPVVARVAAVRRAAVLAADEGHAVAALHAVAVRCGAVRDVAAAPAPSMG